MKAIIIYYSKSGTTEKLAKKIQSDLGCNILKLEAKEPYGSYISSIVRVASEKMRKATPEVITPVPALDEYDTVLLGFPIWYQKMPEFMVGFIKECDLQGKIVIPFATFGGTGLSWAMKQLTEVCKSADIKYAFDQGMLKKDDYGVWLNNVKSL